MTKDAIRTATVLLLAFAAAASAQTPAGGEVLVNTYTTGSQRRARVAMEPDGDFVVVWTSFDQDGDNYGAFGQRFAASGAPRGNEFRVNTDTTGQQFRPAVAVGSRGDFVVVWESVEDGSGLSIQGRRYDASGDPIGAEFLVNTFTTGDQYSAHVGRASDGRFVVSWTSQDVDGSSHGIAARRFDASGNPIGSEFVVNTYTTGYQRLGHLAVEGNGDFVAVWGDYNNRDGSGSAIFGQRYDTAGAPVGTEFRLNQITAGDQVANGPTGSEWVAQLTDGRLVATWTGPDADGSGIFVRLIDVPGGGNDAPVNTLPASYTTNEDTAVTLSGLSVADPDAGIGFGYAMSQHWQGSTRNAPRWRTIFDALYGAL